MELFILPVYLNMKIFFSKNPCCKTMNKLNFIALKHIQEYSPLYKREHNCQLQFLLLF